MILVLLGTQTESFERLLKKIDECINKGVIKEKVLVQAGNTKYQSENMEIFDFTSKEEIEEIKRTADFVITHGGVGSIISCLKLGKKVIAVPRLSKYKEHVNDHQLQIVNQFDRKCFIKGITKLEYLEDAILNIGSFIPKKYENNNNQIIKIIDEYIENN